jgi:hypothetical protein
MKVNSIILLAVAAALTVAAVPVGAQEAAGATGYAVYSEAAYTDFVESTMKELDALYLQFCEACGADPTNAHKARQEFLVTVRDLMQYMNGRFDALDPKQGAALSPTETLVSIHSLTMLVDILAATEIEHLQKHPYIE